MSKDNLHQLYTNELATAVRSLAMDAVVHAQSGHLGMPLGMADVATILFSEFLRFNPEDPSWPIRDRFVLSAGHGSMLLYALLYLTGYEAPTLEDIKNFRQLGSRAAGHPEYGHLPGVETTTGPLGQGIANAVGMAIAQRAKGYENFTYVIAGDGCLMEGVAQEAISLAGHLQLSKLIILFDDNQITIDGSKFLADSDDHLAKFRACNWHTQEVDGHDHQQIRQAISNAQQSNLPSVIACKTIIGFGAPAIAGTEKAHGVGLKLSDVEQIKAQYGWDSIEPFYIPQRLLQSWREIGLRYQEMYGAWKNSTHESASILPTNFTQLIREAKKQALQSKSESSRKSSGKVISLLQEHLPLIGGSADLSESNCTINQHSIVIDRDHFKGNYIHYGVREHAMAAIMNGIALYGGLIPFGGTFLVFSDYARPAIRLAALMGLRVIYVFTHDSIALGEDGPTHQPIEHLASLRAMPNLLVLRPADAIETVEAWEIALQHQHGPSVLALSRQNLPLIRTNDDSENKSARGGYVIYNSDLTAQVTIFATGSEVELVISAAKILEKQNIGVKVVSMVCWELFAQQDSQYQRDILCNNTLKVAVEAGCSLGWERYIGAHGLFIGMDSFGASAPAHDLYQFFGITVENIVKKITERLNHGQNCN